MKTRASECLQGAARVDATVGATLGSPVGATVGTPVGVPVGAPVGATPTVASVGGSRCSRYRMEIVVKPAVVYSRYGVESDFHKSTRIMYVFFLFVSSDFFLGGNVYQPLPHIIASQMADILIMTTIIPL